MNALTVKNLTVSYNKKPAIKGINLSIETGSIVGIIGPNGAGKSTLIKAVLGLMSKDTGDVKIFGEKPKDVLNKIAYIPQRNHIDWDFPVSVEDVVLMGRYVHLPLIGFPKENDRVKVREALEKVEMTAFAKRQISSLSGGQQQRIFLARALAQESELYFMDEPFVGVDAKTEQAIFTLMKELKNDGKTMLVVHHDLSEVSTYFDKVILLNQTLVAYGDTDKVFNKENVRKAYGGRLTVLQKTEEYI